MTHSQVLHEMRTHWERTRSGIVHDYWVGFSILHGIVERNQDWWTPQIEEIINNARRELKPSLEMKKVIIPTLRQLVDLGVKIPVHHDCATALSANDVSSISSIHGYFGVFEEITPDGYDTTLMDEKDVGIMDRRVAPIKLFDLVRFPEAYRIKDAGLCWVEYRFQGNRLPVGSFEPASSLEYE